MQGLKMISRCAVFFVAVMGALMMVDGCAETKVGGMSAQNAFSDLVTVEWVKAVEHGNYAKADKLLAQGAKVNLVGREGVTPLFWIMSAVPWEEQRIEYMLKAGADPNYTDPKRQVSAMYYAAGGDRPHILELLLKYKGDVNLLGYDDATDQTSMLGVACLEGRFDNVKILVVNGANVNWIASGGDIPAAAMKALVRGGYDIVFYLLEHGLNVGLDGLGWMTMHRTVPEHSDQYQWREKVIAVLKERGSTFENKNSRK